jgi:hypothetical protein
LRLQEQVLRWGLDALPAPPTPSQPPAAPPTVEELLQSL